jgi:hypothetical protein
LLMMDAPGRIRETTAVDKKGGPWLVNIRG